MTKNPQEIPAAAGRTVGGLALVALIPLLLLGGLIAFLIVGGAGLGERTAPPIEELTIDRITLPAANQIVIAVTNGGADPVTVAQVQVDDAYWNFTITPNATIPRLGRATITLPYPWVQDEAHAVKLLSSNGTPFDGEIPVATRTPAASMAAVGRYALLGIYVGFIPVSLGLLWFPFLRRLGRGGMQAVLSLTVGLLAFLLVDTVAEALEVVGEAAPVFGGGPLVLMVALLSAGALLAVGGGAAARPPRRLAVAYRIALGIGLHNLGEGLAIGAAFASGSAALGTFLVIGFTLHNITEGIGIAAPIAREKPRLAHFVALAALAGLPAVLGVWIGAFVFNTLLTAVFLAMGAGAIAQVIYEVGRMIVRQSAEDATPLFSRPIFGGFVAGV
ncbi:MAG TPA: ZIP family metal transporter, partial [Herpetosiphonaceae bacterium]|nr:ZIP family metal transporter [Herpetosiphonaceae bacterium]